MKYVISREPLAFYGVHEESELGGDEKELTIDLPLDIIDVLESPRKFIIETQDVDIILTPGITVFSETIDASLVEVDPFCISKVIKRDICVPYEDLQDFIDTNFGRKK